MEELIGKRRKYKLMLFDIVNGEKNKSLVKKYGFSKGYISQISKKISQLKFPPTILNNEIICFKCEKPKDNLCIHHNHKTGEQIAIVCCSCNHKLGDNEIEYSLKGYVTRYKNPSKLQKLVYLVGKGLTNKIINEFLKNQYGSGVSNTTILETRQQLGISAENNITLQDLIPPPEKHPNMVEDILWIILFFNRGGSKTNCTKEEIEKIKSIYGVAKEWQKTKK